MLYQQQCLCRMMKIIKLILLAFPVFLASLLLVVNPAHASRFNSTPAIVVTATQANLELATLQINNISHLVIEPTGCSCANCVPANLQMLQGKLPIVGI
jgi:hypothetical protein